MVEDSGFYISILLFPIAILIGFALIAFFIRYFNQTFQHLFLSGSTNTTKSTLLEKRGSKRVRVDGVYALISGNIGQVVGKVQDLSQTGMCISGLPQEKIRDSKQLFIEIATGVQIIRMRITLKWESSQAELKNIGVAIEYAPLEWHEFVIKQYQVLPG